MRYDIAIILYMGICSIVTRGLRGRDKWAAIRGARRIPEKVLLLRCMSGGWPGGLLGIWIWKHKYRKVGFVWHIYAIACVWMCAIIYTIYVM